MACWRRSVAVVLGCLLAMLVSTALDGSRADAAPRFRIVNLSELGYSSLDARAINDAGQVTGNIWQAQPLNRRSAFLFDDGVVTLLPSTLGGPDAEGCAGNGRAWTFNDRSSAPAGGIVKLKLIDRGRGATPRRVSVLVSGRNALYPVVRGDAPVQAILALGDAAASAAGRCGESSFASGDCRFDARATTLACTR